MFSKDFLLRQIEMMTRAIAQVIFGKHDETAEMAISYADNIETLNLELLLDELIKEKEFNKAEDALFEYIYAHPDRNAAETAMRFYNKLNRYSDDDLESASFPREEILAGLEKIKELYSRS